MRVGRMMMVVVVIVMMIVAMPVIVRVVVMVRSFQTAEPGAERVTELAIRHV